MQLQDLSYKLNNQTIPLLVDSAECYASVEVFSMENVYTIPDGGYKRSGRTYVADSLVWGDTERVNGEVKLDISEIADGKTFKINASLDRDVRGVKLRLDGLPLGTLISLTSEDREVTEHGLRFTYPEGWRSLSTPLLVFRLIDGRYLYIRCLDVTVNEKRFFIKRTGDVMRVDIVQDQDGTAISHKYDVPVIECGIVDDVQTVYARQSDYVKKTYGLDDYENCSIAPSWLKDISLVVTMHMQAFTGHIFHTYEQAYRDVEKLCKLIDGKRVLVYLAGWEGRYYYKYGDYTPDSRLGGAKALKSTVEKMRALGCRVMAMYGMNMANKNIPAVAQIVDESEFQSVSGARYHSGSVDWEGAHHYDFNELVQLNIASKKWCDYLFGQIKNATEEFGFDGAFLDIAACYTNDKNNKLYEGVVAFCDRLRTIKPDFLVSGEGYYDGLSRAMPLFQSGHTDGWLHYHDRASELLFTRFSREFAHLCIGDPSRGSSGVHELGQNTDRITPLRKGIIPTLALVENTMDNALDKVKEIVELAKEYERRYSDAAPID